MTLRQHYAGLVMQAIIAHEGPDAHKDSVWFDVGRAVIYADAIIAELEKKEGG